MVSNKEVIHKLQQYFLQQDPAIVARLLAATMIDLHRFNNLDSLDNEETDSLFRRSALNSLQLIEFVKNGPNGLLAMILNEAESK